MSGDSPTVGANKIFRELVGDADNIEEEEAGGDGVGSAVNGRGLLDLAQQLATRTPANKNKNSSSNNSSIGGGGPWYPPRHRQLKRGCSPGMEDTLCQECQETSQKARAQEAATEQYCSNERITRTAAVSVTAAMETSNNKRQ